MESAGFQLRSLQSFLLLTPRALSNNALRPAQPHLLWDVIYIYIKGLFDGRRGNWVDVSYQMLDISN